MRSFFLKARSLRRGQGGLTLAEMLVVLAVIAILLAIALPVYAKQREVAQEAAAETRLHLALRIARHVATLNGGAFPAPAELAQRMQESEPSLNTEVLPSLLAPAKPGFTYVVKSGTSKGSLLLAAKSEAGTLHSLFWEDGKSTYSRTRQPTYEELVLSLGPSAYWPLSTNLLDLSGNGWTLSPYAQGSIQAGGGNPLLLDEQGPSTFFDGGADSFFQSDYITRRNLIHNPDGETTATWSYQAGSEVSPVVDTNHARFGSSSLRITTTGTKTFDEGFQGHPTPLLGEIVPGKHYTLSGYMRNEDGVPMRAAIEWRREDLSQITGATAHGASLVSNGEWVRVSVTGIAPPEAAAASPKFVFQGHGQKIGPHTVWLDGVLLEQTSLLRPYFSGAGYVDESGQWVSQPNAQTGDRRTGWAGAPHASESAFGVFADGTQRTFIVWARAADIDNRRPMVGARYLYGLMDIRRTPGPNSSLEVRLGEQSFVYDDSWPGPNEPVMVALVVDEVSDKVEAYVNGRELPEIQKAWDWSKGAKEFFLIGYSAASGQRWYGDLGHVAVFERALTPDQICSLWQAGSGKDC